MPMTYHDLYRASKPISSIEPSIEPNKGPLLPALETADFRTKQGRLSDDPLFRAIAWAFHNEDMTDAEQMKAFRALRKAGVLK